MIKNDRQYQLVKSTLRKFQATVEHHDLLTKGEKTWVKKLHKATIAGEVKELQTQVSKYEALKFGKSALPQIAPLKDIPDMLIKRRIALGWTQEDLAKRLHVRSQQVQNDEATNYASANLARLTKIAQVLQEGKRKAIVSAIAIMRPARASKRKAASQ